MVICDVITLHYGVRTGAGKEQYAIVTTGTQTQIFDVFFGGSHETYSFIDGDTIVCLELKKEPVKVDSLLCYLSLDMLFLIW